MAFTCPGCATDALEITRSIELMPDASNDELTLQTVQCSRCGFHGAALYEESRHGALDSESSRHHGQELSEAAWEALLATISGCPSLRNIHCTCALHARLSGATRYQIWNALRQDDAGLKAEFEIRYVPDR
jgi:hypothetical protein